MWHSIESRHRFPPVVAPTFVTLAIMGFLLVGLGTTATAVWSLKSTPLVPGSRATSEELPLSAGGGFAGPTRVRTRDELPRVYLSA